MAGIVEKVKAKVDQTLHKDKTHDETTGVGHSSTGTHNPVDRNNDGRVNASDLTGSSTTHGTHGTTGGLGSSTHGTHGTANPLDRNNDGRTNVSDLTGSSTHGTHGTTGYGSTGNSSGLTGALAGSDPTGPHDTRTANKLDPRVDSDRYGSAGNTAGAGGYGSNTGSGLTGHSTTGHHNTAGGLGSSTGAGYGSTTHGTANPLDRNNDGRTNVSDLTGSSTHGTHGTHGIHGTANPLDRNNDGRTNVSDLTGSSTHGTHGSSGLTGSNTGYNTSAGGVGAGQYAEGHHGTHGTANPLDRNNDGRVTAGDVTGSSTHGTHGTSGGIGGTHGSSAGAYNDGTIPPTNLPESELPKALVEPVSKAQPHSALPDNHNSSAHGNQHDTGVNTHGNAGTHGKPSLVDKLNPKKDADGDGKAGFMK